MTLKEANYQVEKLENEINLLLKEKESLEAKTGVQAINTDKMLVDGGKRVDRLVEYVSSDKTLLQLDEEINQKQERKINLMNWIDQELKILKKYKKVEQLIVYYKEIDTKEYTWANISFMVHYSASQCRNIYRNYKRKRNI